MATKIDARLIGDLLATRHSRDVFVPQCKNGPTVSAQHLRMDAWALTKSWTRTLATAYEIKISRSDFVADDKWQLYLPYCNEFYFVTPSKLVAPEELPTEVGLLWASRTGTRLFTKKKAARRQVQIPQQLFLYLLICRARIKAHDFEDMPQTDYWRAWLAEKAEKQEIGHRVSARIAAMYHDVRNENRRLQRCIESYGPVRDRLRELGMNPDMPLDTWEIKGLADRVNGVNPNLNYELRSAIRDLSQLQKVLFPEEQEAGP